MQTSLIARYCPLLPEKHGFHLRFTSLVSDTDHETPIDHLRKEDTWKFMLIGSSVAQPSMPRLSVTDDWIE